MRKQLGPLTLFQHGPYSTVGRTFLLFWATHLEVLLNRFWGGIYFRFALDLSESGAVFSPHFFKSPCLGEEWVVSS